MNGYVDLDRGAELKRARAQEFACGFAPLPGQESLACFETPDGDRFAIGTTPGLATVSILRGRLGTGDDLRRAWESAQLRRP